MNRYLDAEAKQRGVTLSTRKVHQQETAADETDCPAQLELGADGCVGWSTAVRTVSLIRRRKLHACAGSIGRCVASLYPRLGTPGMRCHALEGYPLEKHVTDRSQPVPG